MIANHTEIERALSFISADLPREDWIAIGDALKNEGLDISVFDNWSATADSYKPKECRQQWNSFKGKHTAGTIFHYAKQNGFEFDKTSKPDYSAIEKQKAEARAKAEQQAKTAANLAKEAAKKCAQIYAMSQPADNSHPYLLKKQVKAHGLRKDVAGNLIIPVFNTEFSVISLQTISASGDKKFFYQAEFNGGFFLVGEVYPDCEIYITEGYATGATIHELTGCPVYIAFTAGNLITVCQYVRSQFETRDIVICSDNDHTDKQGNPRPADKNTGLIAATKAANLINAQVRLPKCGGSDFNDLFIESGREECISQIYNIEKIESPLVNSEHFSAGNAERMLVDLSDIQQVNEFTESLLSRIGDNENELEVINIVVNEIVHNCIEFDKTVADYIVGQIVKKDAFRTKKTALKTGIMARFKTEKKEVRKKIKQEFVPLNKPLVKEQFPDLVEADNGASIIATTENNLKHLLKSYGIAAVYDEAVKSQELFIPGMQDIDHDLYNEATLQKICSLASLNNINQKIINLIPIVMTENTVNPVKDWILSKEWDGKQRIIELSDTLIIEDKGKNDLKNKILFTWLVQCVAALDRARIGCKLNPYAVPKYELILILQAKQGLTKTTWFTNLLPRDIDIINNEESKSYLFGGRYIKKGSNLALDNRDSIKQNVSCWINELGELDATFKKTEISQLKAFCSNETDVLRLPFARAECKFKRSTSFCASVNDSNFLNDPTGSRRMGVISLSGIVENHGIDMQQMWREVWDFYADGENWWLDKETENAMQENNRLNHQSLSPIEEIIRSSFDWDAPKHLWTHKHTATQIYQLFFDKKPDKKEVNSIKPILIELGVQSVPSRGYTWYKMPPKADVD